MALGIGKEQDSKNRFGLRLLFAPDVVQGDDGRYYMYYAFDFMCFPKFPALRRKS